MINDVVQALTDSVQPVGYVKDMRRRDPELSKGWGQIATPLSIQTAGGIQNSIVQRGGTNCTPPVLEKKTRKKVSTKQNCLPGKEQGKLEDGNE